MLNRLLQIVKRERARGSAILLLVCFFLPFVQTAIASTHDPEALLPVCCRTHGKHKCSMQARSDQQTSPSFSNRSTLSERCPQLPANNACPFHSLLAPVASRSPGLAIVEAKLSLPVQTSKFRSDEQSANQKRGPPSIVASS